MSGLSRKLVILGNGSSLNEHVARGDFVALEGVPTMAMNLIDWLYPSVMWRPTYYLLMEHIGNNLPYLEHWERVVQRHILSDEVCLLDRKFRPPITKACDGLGVSIDILEGSRWLVRAMCQHGSGRTGPGDEPKPDYPHFPEAWHLPEICPFAGSVHAALQVAFMMGFKDVALIGCDLGLTSDGSDHFDPNYKTYCDYPLPVLNVHLRHAHELAAKEFGFAGRRLVNCGIGGSLDVHWRMPLEEWLNES